MNSTENRSDSDNELSIHNLVDSHLKQLRWFAYGLGGLALILILKKVKVAKKFQGLAEIPADFIKNAYTLQGQIQDVTNTGVLLIDHEPIVRFQTFVKRPKPNSANSLLPVTLAGVSHTQDSVLWLRESVARQHVWFKLLKVDESSVDCEVKIKRNAILKLNLNEEVVRKGLCVVKHFDSPPKEPEYSNLIRKLIALEHKASIKDRGMWKDDRKTSSWNFVGKGKSFLQFLRQKLKFRWKGGDRGKTT